VADEQALTLFDVRPVPGWEGLYDVTRDGRVLSLRRGHEVRLDPSGRDRTYRRVELWRDGKRTRVLVHRLVAEVFIGPQPSPEHMVCHKNDQSDDNRVENLYWGTREDNEMDRYVNGLPLDEMEEAPF